MEQQRQNRRGFDRDAFAMGDPFFDSFGMRSGRHHNAFDEFHFMDPFELFNRFFSDEMDQMNGNQRQRSSRSSRSAFNHDPFFDSDPFFSGFGGGSMMSRHFGMMNEMNNLMMNSQRSMIDNQQMMSGGSFYSSSSSSRGAGQSVSTSTRTTIVNGVRTTVTERTIVHPDGRVERHVESSGGQNEALPSSYSSRRAIGYGDNRSRRR